MPIVHAVVESPVSESFRVRQVQGMFDLPPAVNSRSIFNVEIPATDEPWAIGLIVGPSGSGKTTVARQAFGEKWIERWNWPENQSVLDGFPKQNGIGEITQLLSSVGFSSPPAWVRPFKALSNGEQFRVNLARTLAEMPDLAVIDEFTSVVDRTVAKIGSAALAKTIRRRNQKFIAVTCHYDVLPWLQPDWVLDMADGSLTRGSLRRPDINLQIIRCRASAWKLFKRHHYLSGEIHPSSQCFMGLICDEPAAFVAALPFPHPNRSGWREHRCVCLPDFQGLGIGHAISEFVASLYAATGKPYTSITSHPAMIRHRACSPLWRMIRVPSRQRSFNCSMAHLDKTLSWRRMTASFLFTGSARSDLAKNFGVCKRIIDARNIFQR